MVLNRGESDMDNIRLDMFLYLNQSGCGQKSEDPTNIRILIHICQRKMDMDRQLFDLYSNIRMYL